MFPGPERGPPGDGCPGRSEDMAGRRRTRVPAARDPTRGRREKRWEQRSGPRPLPCLTHQLSKNRLLSLPGAVFCRPGSLPDLPGALRALPDGLFACPAPFQASERSSCVPGRPSCLPASSSCDPDRRSALPASHPVLPRRYPTLPRRHPALEALHPGLGSRIQGIEVAIPPWKSIGALSKKPIQPFSSVAHESVAVISLPSQPLLGLPGDGASRIRES